MATGGPDDETWKKMTRTEKLIYWICIALFAAAMVAAALYKALS